MRTRLSEPTKRLELRITAQERERLDELATEQNTNAQTVMVKALREIIGATHLWVDDFDRLIELRAEILACGINLNQIARKANAATTSLVHVDKATLEKAIELFKAAIAEIDVIAKKQNSRWVK
jgi:hypothetical protein